MDCTIRVLTEQDSDIFFAIRGEALLNEPRSFGASHVEHMTNAAEVKARVVKPDTFILGAFAPELIGIAGFFRAPGLKSQHKGTIWGVYVTSAHRGKGVARRLMIATIDRCRTISGIERLLLTVATQNTSARKLYSSLGFESYGVEKRALKVDSQYVDEEMMSLDLAAVQA